MKIEKMRFMSISRIGGGGVHYPSPGDLVKFQLFFSSILLVFSIYYLLWIFFGGGASRPCGPAGWPALLLLKAGDVWTNLGPTTTHKQIWICDICHKQIHGWKQISIRCNMMEHWVHLRCAGIRLAQYKDTWTCHLHQ